jgi:signal peptide peptidase SppA
MNNYGQIVSKIVGTPWLIMPESLGMILQLIDRKVSGEVLTEEDYMLFEQRGSNRDSLELPDTPGPAVLNIVGPIFGKANLMTSMSGATSVEKLQNDFRMLVDSPQATSIILNIDSPGGTSDLIMEMGDEIYNARGKKPIIAVANTTAASAAYWLATQADELYMTPSGKVGSVGAYTVHDDISGALEKEGVKKTIISAGRFKVEGNPYEPLTDEARGFAQERIDELLGQFTSAIARGRGISEEAVREGYGQGRVFTANTATALGMVDGVKTLDEVVEYAGAPRSSSNYSYNLNFTPATQRMEDSMSGFTPKMLEALGLGEDASLEDIEAAIVEMSSEIAPLREVSSKQRAFAEAFPEEAAKLRALEESDRDKSAKLFSEGYTKFENGSGFTGLALSQIENMHKQISVGGVTHDELKGFLDAISSGSALVDYREIGSTRGSELADDSAVDSREAAKKLSSFALAAQAEAGGSDKLSWGDALAQVSRDNPELARLYSQALQGGDK